MADQILANGTGGVSSRKFEIKTPREPVTCVMTGSTLGVDTIDLEISYDDGTNFQKAYDPNGTQIQLSATRTGMSFDKPGIFRFTRIASTTNSVGVAAYGDFKEVL